ncbi:unannotated protein [freshwater metagenome]|uniref:Unannotated protein n=1 Tax=freshwater metagenome TaxID=449393 RepID=A0A6J7JAF2_9ZZZZ
MVADRRGVESRLLRDHRECERLVERVAVPCLTPHRQRNRKLHGSPSGSDLREIA